MKMGVGEVCICDDEKHETKTHAYHGQVHHPCGMEEAEREPRRFTTGNGWALRQPS